MLQSLSQTVLNIHQLTLNVGVIRSMVFRVQLRIFILTTNGMLCIDKKHLPHVHIKTGGALHHYEEREIFLFKYNRVVNFR